MIPGIARAIIRRDRAISRKSATESLRVGPLSSLAKGGHKGIAIAPVGNLVVHLEKGTIVRRVLRGERGVRGS